MSHLAALYCLMCSCGVMIGDFSAFSKPKQLFAYFGLDPAVKQSGKFEGTKVQMSKRGSSIARRVIHTLALQSISISRNGRADKKHGCTLKTSYKN